MEIDLLDTKLRRNKSFPMCDIHRYVQHKFGVNKSRRRLPMWKRSSIKASDNNGVQMFGVGPKSEEDDMRIKES